MEYQEYQLTENEIMDILDASLYIWGARRRKIEVWKKIGEARGFQWATVRPHPDKGPTQFLAFPIKKEENAQ